MKNLYKKIIFLTLILVIFGISRLVMAYNLPSSNPYNSSDYRYPPLHSGTESQTKAASLTVATSPSVTVGLVIPNGQVAIGNTATSSWGTSKGLTIIGQMKITDGSQGTGKVLRSDASGVGTWVGGTSYATKRVISAFNQDGCPAGWNLYTNVSGRVIVGTGNSATTSSANIYLTERKGTEKELLSDSELHYHQHAYIQNQGDDVAKGSKGFPVIGNVWTSEMYKPDGTLVPAPQTPHNNMQPYVVKTYCYIDL